MADVDKALDGAGLKNPQLREYVRYWADLTGAERVEVVSAADDARLIQESLDADELLPAGHGRYYSRGYHKDTARWARNTSRTSRTPISSCAPSMCRRRRLIEPDRVGVRRQPASPSWTQPPLRQHMTS